MEDNEDIETDEIDGKEAIDQFKKIWRRLDNKDLLIILLMLLMLLMYIFHTREIDRCVVYFNDLLINRSSRVLTNFPVC